MKLSRRVERQRAASLHPPRKEDALCCLKRRDVLGRLPVGWCSPGCVRRPSNWAKLRSRVTGGARA